MNQRAKSKMNPSVTAFVERSEKWQAEFEILRGILVDSPLVEESKWGKPCYTFEGSNVVILQGFKTSCAMLFPKGALLKDIAGLLEKPGANTQSARRIPFTNAAQITKAKKILKAYVAEAIDLEKSGAKVKFKTVSEFSVPQELQEKLDSDPKFKRAFKGLTPGRQRGYLLHFSAAKQPQTRASRIEKCVEPILQGRGLNDR